MMIGYQKTLAAGIRGSFLLFSFFLGATAWAQDSSAPLRQVRVIETSDYFDRPDLATELEQAGLAFPPGAGTLLIVDEATPEASTLVVVEPGTDPESSANETLDVDPLNVAFDSKTESERPADEVGLVLFEEGTQDLMAIKTGSDGELDPEEMISIETESFDVGTPRGTTLDPASGRIYVLDGDEPRIVATESEPNGGGFSAIPLDLSATDLQGLAFNPANGHLYILSATSETLYEVTQSGELVVTYDLSDFEEIDPIGMVFAPSGDLSDDPSVMNLFMASTRFGSEGVEPVVIEWSFTPLPQRSEVVEEASLRGQLVARATDQLVALAAEAGNLVNTIDGSALSPPSPDSAGIAYLSGNNSLLFSDSEVNEIDSLFAGVNLWEIEPDGSVLATSDTTAASPDDSREPTGVAYDPVNNVVYISDDDADMIFELTPGDDGNFFTDDDNFTAVINTRLFSPSSEDPEGIAFDTDQRALFIVDGVNNEVYRVDPGSNGEFGDGDDVETNFDTAVLGISDPEGITYDTVNPGHLYIQGAPDGTVDHITIAGNFVRDIDTSDASPRTPAGLALAPGSTNDSDMNLYITDRGVDNCSDPNENDGEIFEFSIPPLDGGGDPMPPTVDAGLDQTIALPDTDAQLDGAVTDDGLPDPVTTNWSGPEGVTFDDPSAVDTTATFPGVGSFVLVLEADDGQFLVSDTVTITVEAEGNQPPVVDAGPNQTITLPDNDVQLDGTVSDDGVPAAVTTLWSGPSEVTFADASAVDTTATFSGPGSYELQLEADDGELVTTDTVMITVFPDGGGIITVESAVAASADDAEEPESGAVKLDSSDLELVNDGGGGDQTVGMRFRALNIPQGAAIVDAYVQFQADDSDSGSISLTIAGEAVDDAGEFTADNNNISSRPTTDASAAWSPAQWTIGDAGSDQRTPNISAVIQEIVNRPDWVSGNALAIIITGTGVRTAESFEGNANASPLLHVEYATTDTGDNQAPTADAGPDQTITLPDNDVVLEGSAGDDGLPDPPAALTIRWSGPNGVTFTDASAIDTTVTFPGAGSYVLQLEADDGELTTTDTVTITVNPDGGGGPAVTVESRVATGSDDAEEQAPGNIRLTSSDLEMVLESGGDQTVGMRFTELPIPPGATIASAYIQFQADESQSSATTLTIQGEDVDNAATFTGTRQSISSRPRTAAAVTWSSLAAWSKGDAGPDQRTPNIAGVIQAVVNRSGWASGNSLVILITGSGERVAESFEGDQNAAPLLHVEYIAGDIGDNQAPTVDAGPDQTITLPDNEVALDGSVNDDGVPAAVSTLWSGPPEVTFADASAIDTTATFAGPGSYELQLEADDSELTTTDTVTITVNPEGGGGPAVTVESRVATGSDDAEEQAPGNIRLTSSDLEMVLESGGDQTVGMRFTELTIPPGATIASAYIQFQADESQSSATTLTIEGEDVDNAATFTGTRQSISSRPRTAASVTWPSLAAWTKGDAGPDQRTPDISSVVQAVVDRSGWASGNSLVILITGSGERVAESFEGDQNAAALLHVEYVAP